MRNFQYLQLHEILGIKIEGGIGRERYLLSGFDESGGHELGLFGDIAGGGGGIFGGIRRRRRVRVIGREFNRMSVSL